MNRIYILDTTALLSWIIPEGKNIVCTHVLSEVMDELTLTVVDGYIKSGKIIIKDPEEKYILEAVKLARDTGDYVKLSETDIHIIALALEYHEENEDVVVVTDDYSIQNILSKKNIRFQGYFRRIKKEVEWVLVCSQCGKVYPPDYPKKHCEICGGTIIRHRKR